MVCLCSSGHAQQDRSVHKLPLVEPTECAPGRFADTEGRGPQGTMICKSRDSDRSRRAGTSTGPIHYGCKIRMGRGGDEKLTFWTPLVCYAFKPALVSLLRSSSPQWKINRRLESIQCRTGVWKYHRSLSPDPSPSTGQNFWTHGCTSFIQYWLGSGNVRGRAQFPPALALDKNRSRT